MQDQNAAKTVTKIECPVPAGARPLRVAAYCRVSTDSDAQLESLDAQRHHYERFIRSNPAWICAGIYVDEGLSGTKLERRAGLLSLISDCEDGKIDLILTKSVSRFSRDTADCLRLVRRLKERGVFIQFEREGIHTGTMDSELMLSILSGMAEDESFSISQNTKWSIRRRFQNGSYKVSCAPYGYRAENGAYIVNEPEAEVVRSIFAGVLSGKGASAIARELNERGISARRGGKWTDATVRGIISNEAYTGELVLQKTFTDDAFCRHRNRGECARYRVPEHHAAIISRAEFDAAQEVVRRHAREKGIGGDREKYGARYPFSGKIVCGACGGTFKRRVHSSGHVAVAWCCATHLMEVEKCPMKFVPETQLAAAFLTAMNRIIFGHKAVLKPLLARLRDMDGGACAEETRRVDEQIAECERQADVLSTLRAKGYLDGAAYRQGANELHQEAKRLRLQREACLRVKENGRAYVDALNALIRWAGKAEPLIAFDAELFAQFVNRIRVFSRAEAGFELTCGITLREPLTGRVCDTFRMAGETEPFGDPFRQAEHTYSLIQEVPDGNQ